ncbi:MAG TPA: SDR family oxidoreductase [Aeromicrobium sp.]|nr:SDR family oxidoreductase [Aeromicrobium sp.]
MKLRTNRKIALVTGGSAGLGRALVAALADAGWTVITDGRRAARLAELPSGVIAIAGDITDADHRTAMVAEVTRHGRLDLLVHNAGSLGPTPLPRLEAITADDLQALWRPNVGAPLIFTGQLLPYLAAAGGVLLTISSDAAVEHYPGWGLYGASKAALDHIALQYAAENPRITAYAVDPGDMRTDMHQAAFPGEDISDRPEPASVVPAILQLIDSGTSSGRYRAADVPVPLSMSGPVSGVVA